MFWIDYWYIVLVLPALLVSAWAQFKVKSTFHKYAQVRVRCGMTGAEAAQTIQRANGLLMPVERIGGSLSDHFDPRAQAIRLSEPVYGHASVAAVGVAAHETGHALQYSENYTPMRVRAAMVKPTQFASTLMPILIIVGIATSNSLLAMVGVALFGVAALFQLVTLPVEFNASRRAVQALQADGRLSEQELAGVKKVLTAAALTYVAALLVSMAQLLRLLLIVGSRRRD